jgi:hypothetical protein
MKNYRFVVAVLTTLAACNIVACKKKPTDSTGCSTSIISAYTPEPPSTRFDSIGVGIFDGTNATFNRFGSIYNFQSNNQAAYNSSDRCYYSFRNGGRSLSNCLYKTTEDGTTTTFTSSIQGYFDGLIYNKANNKLYCIYLPLHGSGTTPCQIVEITTGDNSYTFTPVVTTEGHQWDELAATSAVDQSTGSIYFTTKAAQTGIYTIEKYVQGATETIVLTTGNDKRIMGLQYNRTDNMLYAVSEEFPTGMSNAVYHFVRIDPNTGTIVPMTILPFRPNKLYYSSALNPCSNRYYFSAKTGLANDTNIVAQFDMNGNIVQQNTTTGLHHGMAIKE